MGSIYNIAMNIAQTCDVSTPENGLVIYSVSFQPNKDNRDNAFDYVKKHKDKMVIEHTECGAKLIEIGLAGNNTGLTDDEVQHIWGIASRRMIAQAKGDITAFVDNADYRSVFRSVELPNILVNPNIKSINKIPKARFARQFREN